MKKLVRLLMDEKLKVLNGFRISASLRETKKLIVWDKKPMNRQLTTD